MLPLGSWNFRFLGVSVAGDSRHAEFVRRTIGTASLWRPAISLACRRRTCYADTMLPLGEPHEDFEVAVCKRPPAFDIL